MRILYIAIFSKPLNNIASLRTNAFVKNLPKFNVEIDVLTRYYDEQQIKGELFKYSFLPPQNFNKPYVRVNNIVYTNVEDYKKREAFSNSLPFGIRTLYSFLQKDLYHKGWVKFALDAFDSELSSNKYDFIIASYGPLASCEIASKISKKYKIPWIAEYRDTYIGLKQESRFSILLKRLVQYQLLKTSKGVIAICEGIETAFKKHALGKLKNLPICIVNNGIDENIIAEPDVDDLLIVDVIGKLKKSETLVLLHTGTLYKGQNIDFFTDSIQRFNKENSTQIQLVCVGINPEEYDVRELENKNVNIFRKVKNETSLYLQTIVDGLVLPAWNKNRYTGFVDKIFEYIYSGNNVLCSPEPVKDLEFFLTNFYNVTICPGYDAFEQSIKYIIKNRRQTPPAKNVDQLLFRKYWIEQLVFFLKKLKAS